MATDPDIVDDAEFLEQRRALEGADQPALGQFAGLKPRDVLTFVEDLAARRLVVPADQAECGRLAGPVGADETVDAVAPDGEGQIVDGCQPAKLPCDVAQFKNRCVGQCTPPNWLLSGKAGRRGYSRSPAHGFYSAAAGVFAAPR